MFHVSAAQPTAERGVLNIDGFELGYAIEGVGSPTLVIGSSVYYPRTFSPTLRESLKLVFLDHRGFAPHTGAISPEHIALEHVLSDMAQASNALKLGRHIVIGHSGHGYMALEYAKRYPQNVSHVVLIATGPSHSTTHADMGERHWQEAVCPERRAQYERDMAGLADELKAAPEKRFVTFCIRMGARSWYDATFDARPLWDGVHVNMAVIDHLWGEAFRDLDVARGLESLDIPVFLAVGRFDYLVSPVSAWEPYRSQFHDLTVRVFDKSSHTPQLEESELFDRELLDWLSGKRR